MSRYIVSGSSSLNGEISLRGAKNASYKQIIASMLSEETTQLLNVPQISDVKITQSIAKQIGSQFVETGEHCLSITTKEINSNIVPIGTGEKSRTSFMFAAPLLIRTGKAIIPVPGGDKLGDRPLDRLFDCFRQMNIECVQKDNIIEFSTTGIKPTTFSFKKSTHTVTEVIIMIASLVKGQTVLQNTAIEPEVNDLIEMLNSMGADIKRDENNQKTIIINGVEKLHGTTHQIISDRNEAITFMCAALATKGSVNILRINPENVKTFLTTVEKMGAEVKVGTDEVSVKWVRPLKAIDIQTGPEPEFMTDWQAIFSILLTQAIGCSTVIERVYPYRFHHIPNLIKMGTKATLFNPVVENPQDYYEFNPNTDKPEYFHGVKIYGPTKLKPSTFEINDLRSGALTTIAALMAEGESIINGVEYIERGYEKLADRLKSLGANIQYIKT